MSSHNFSYLSDECEHNFPRLIYKKSQLGVSLNVLSLKVWISLRKEGHSGHCQCSMIMPFQVRALLLV